MTRELNIERSLFIRLYRKLSELIETTSYLRLANPMVLEAAWKENAPILLFQRGTGKPENKGTKFARRMKTPQLQTKSSC